MQYVRSQRAILLATILGAASGVCAADVPPTRGKPMKMDEPMKTGMMKPGMKVGDVKKAAEKRAGELKPTVERESASAKK